MGFKRGEPLKNPYDGGVMPRRQFLALEIQKLWIAKGIHDRDLVQRLRNIGVKVAPESIQQMRHGQFTPSLELMRNICNALHLNREEKLKLWRAKALDDGYDI